MPIVAKFDIDRIFAKMEAKLDDIQNAVIEAVKLACTQTVAKARGLDTYKDRTFLLRSSVGFVIYDHGNKVHDDFHNAGGEKGGEGAAKGAAVAEEAAKKHLDCIVGAVVAGAHYTLFVESRGYDVITGPCSELNELLSQYLAEAVKFFKK